MEQSEVPPAAPQEDAGPQKETPKEEMTRDELFKEVKFCICENVQDVEETKKVLVDGGGTLVNYMSDNVTHLVADNDDHPDVSEALEIYEKPVVTSRWVFLSSKAGQLLPNQAFSPSKSQLFSKIVACSSKLSRADLQACWAMVTFYGGSFKLDLDTSCTHLISTKPEGAKYDRAVDTNDKIKIVTPDWVIDSVKNKTRCDEELYHPRLLILPNAMAKAIYSQPAEGSILKAAVTNPNNSSQPSVTAVATSQVSVRAVSLPQAVISQVPTSQAGIQQPQGVASQGRQIRLFMPGGQQQQQIRVMQLQQRPQMRPQQPGVPPITMPLQQQQQQHVGDGQQAQNQQWVQSQMQQQQTRPMQQVNFQQDQVRGQQPRQVYVMQQSQQPGHQIRQQHFIQINQGQQQQQFIQQQQQPQSQQGNHQQHQQYAQNQQQQQNQQPVPGRGGNVILQQRIQPPVHIAGQTGQPMVHQPNPNQMSAQQGQSQVRMMSNQQPMQMPQQRQGSPQVNIRGGQPQQVVYQQQMMQQRQPLQPGSTNWTTMSFDKTNQQQQPYAQPPQGMQQQVQRVPHITRMQMQPRGQIRAPIRGQQGQPQTFLQTNPDGTQSRILVRPQQQFPHQVQQLDPSGQGKPQMVRHVSPQGFVRGQGWPQDMSPQHQQLVRAPQQVVMSPQAMPQNHQQQQVWQQQQQLQQQPQQQHPDVRRGQMMVQAPSGQAPNARFPTSMPAGAQVNEQVRPPASAAPAMPGARPAGPPSTAAPGAPLQPPQQQTSPAPQQQALSSLLAMQLQSPENQTLSNARSQSVSNNSAPAAAKSSLTLDASSVASSGNCSSNSNSSNSTPTSIGAPILSAGIVSGDATFAPSATPTGVSNRLACVGSPGVILPTGEILHRGIAEPPPVQEQYYGHDSSLQIPSRLPLMGCVFFMTGYTGNSKFKLNDKQRTSMERKMKRNGAEIEVTYSQRCTHVMTDSQDYQVVQQALKDGKRVVTIYWIEDILCSDPPGPMRPPWKANHLPMGGSHVAAQCKHYLISSSGFSTEERELLKEISYYIDANYTTYTTQKHTALVCKKLESEKYKKAIEWCLPIVNAQWLIDTYLGIGDVLSAPIGSNPRHKKFEVPNAVELDYSTMRPLMNAWLTPLCIPEEDFKRILEASAQDQSKAKTSTPSEHSEVLLPTLASEKSNDENIPANVDLDTSQTNAVLVSAVSEADRKEIQAPQGESAVLRPVEDLSNVTSNGEPPAKRVKLEDNAAHENGLAKLLASTPTPADGVSCVGPNALPPPPPLTLAPFVSLSNPEAGAIKVLFSGLMSDEEERLAQIVKRLGGKTTTIASSCTHLVVDKIRRTTKFLCAFSHAAHILAPSWLEESNQMNRFCSEESHVLNDPEGEALFGFSLKESLRKRNERKPEKRFIFEDIIFYVTPSHKQPAKVIETVIKSANGQAVFSDAPTKNQLRKLRERGLDFVIISCEEDMHLCEKFFRRDVFVLDVEFIFSSILKQELNYKQHQMSYDYIDYRGPDFDGCTNCTDLVKGGGDCLSLSRSSCI